MRMLAVLVWGLGLRYLVLIPVYGHRAGLVEGIWRSPPYAHHQQFRARVLRPCSETTKPSPKGNQRGRRSVGL